MTTVNSGLNATEAVNDSLPTHPASTDSPAEGGAVFVNGLYLHPIENMLVRVTAVRSDGRVSYTHYEPTGRGQCRASDLRHLPRPAPIEPGVREKVADRIDDEWRALFGDGPDSFANPGVIHYDEFRSACLALLSSNTGEG